jgi:hypothetical protein
VTMAGRKWGYAVLRNWHFSGPSSYFSVSQPDHLALLPRSGWQRDLNPSDSLRRFPRAFYFRCRQDPRKPRTRICPIRRLLVRALALRWSALGCVERGRGAASRVKGGCRQRHHPAREWGRNEIDRQAHAANEPRALAFAPGSPVWSADAERKALPVARGKGQEKVSNARGRKG